MTISPSGVAPNVPMVAPWPIWSASAWALAVLRLMNSMVWPCFAARVPMAVAMLPEPMMLMMVMTCVPPLCLDQGWLWGSCWRDGLACRRFAHAWVSNQSEEAKPESTE
jgi:hypothetical protein